MLLETYLLIKQPIIMDVVIDKQIVCYDPGSKIGGPKTSRSSGTRLFNKEIG